MKSTSWADIYTSQNPDSDELLVRNSFLNGLAQKPIESLNSTYTRPTTSSYKLNKTKLKWADNGMNNRRDMLLQCSGKNDLYNLKEKDLNKPVVSHLKSRPHKSIIKHTGIIDNFTGVFKRPNTGNVKNTDTSLGGGSNTLSNSKNYSSNMNMDNQRVREEPIRQNNFMNNKGPSTNHSRPYTSEQKDQKVNNAFAKIIITPVQSITTNNTYNNIIIQSPNNDLDVKKISQLYHLPSNNDNSNDHMRNKVKRIRLILPLPLGKQ